MTKKIFPGSYKVVIPAVLIPAIIVAIVVAAGMMPKEPKFTTFDFQEEYNESTSFNQIATYTVYNPLDDSVNCSIDFFVDNGDNASSEVFGLGVLKPKTEFSGNFTFFMPSGESKVEMQLDCK